MLAAQQKPVHLGRCPARVLLWSACWMKTTCPERSRDGERIGPAGPEGGTSLLGGLLLPEVAKTHQMKNEAARPDDVPCYSTM